MKTTKKIIAALGLIFGIVLSNNIEANSTEIYTGAFMVIMAVALFIPEKSNHDLT